MVGLLMLKIKNKRLTDRGDRAVKRLAEIETCITGLADNDLLDRADKAELYTPSADSLWRQRDRAALTPYANAKPTHHRTGQFIDQCSAMSSLGTVGFWSYSD